MIEDGMRLPREDQRENSLRASSAPTGASDFTKSDVAAGAAAADWSEPGSRHQRRDGPVLLRRLGSVLYQHRLRRGSFQDPVGATQDRDHGAVDVDLDVRRAGGSSMSQQHQMMPDEAALTGGACSTSAAATLIGYF